MWRVMEREREREMVHDGVGSVVLRQEQKKTNLQLLESSQLLGQAAVQGENQAEQPTSYAD